MLTSDLLRVRVDKKIIRPSLVDAERAVLRERADELVEIYRGARIKGWTREAIGEAVDDLIGDGVDHKLTRGLAKVITDRSTFETQTPIPADELRARLWSAMATHALTEGGGSPSRARAEAIYRDLAAELSLPPDRLRALLFADRKEEQRLVEVDVPDGQWLLHRYNVSLIQSLLLRAIEVSVRLDTPSPERARQLFRYVKFQGLMYRIAAHEGGYTLTLDGPASLLRLNTRYGLKLASWFPALLLQTTPWELTATVLWTKRNLRKTLTLNHEGGLRSHFQDTGAYITRVEEWFQERWAKLDSGWRLSRDRTPLALGGKGVVIPDFTFRKGRKVAHLEIVGIWRKEWLKRRARLLVAHGPGNLVLAVSSKLGGAKGGGGVDLDALPGEVVTFKEVVPAKKVLEAVERVARRPRSRRSAVRG